MSTPRPPQPRVVAVAYGSLAMVLLVVLAAVALVVRPPSQPAVAEFSPTDPERIEEAPDDQSSQFGNGGEGACLDQACTRRAPPRDDRNATTTTTKRQIDRNRVRRCVGAPPRQVEDPQSPPCINYWEGNNGGATAKGVTGDQIRVAISQAQPVADRLATFFNRRFELYGRTLRLVSLGAGTGLDSPPVQRALAAKADELQVFAALGFDSKVNDTRPFATDLARRGIVSVDGQSRMTAGELGGAGPYLWQYSPAVDEAHRAVVRLVCGSLQGRFADYGGPTVRVMTRKFAVLYAQGEGAAPPTQDLVQGMSGCGVTGVPVVAFPREADTEAEYRPLLRQLALDGATTLLCVCYEQERVLAMRAAQSENFQPEWVLTGLLAGENPKLYVDQVPPDQRAHVFGIASDNKYLRPVDEAWYFAIKEADSTFNPGTLDRYSGSAYETYQELLLLVSGIQGAGPRLTPAAFQAALAGTRFPNAGAGSSPHWQARVGFGPADRTMVDDVTLVYWDEAANPEGPTQGGFCYVDRGARYSPDAGPSGTVRFFDKTRPCR